MCRLLVCSDCGFEEFMEGESNCLMYCPPYLRNRSVWLDLGFGRDSASLVYGGCLNKHTIKFKTAAVGFLNINYSRIFDIEAYNRDCMYGVKRNRKLIDLKSILLNIVVAIKA